MEFEVSTGSEGFFHPPVFTEESLRDEKERFRIAKSLIEHGWGSVQIDEQTFAPIQDWENTFSKIFGLPMRDLKGAGVYRSVQGVSVGYRHDTERQFVECRLQTNGIANPEYPSISNYNDVVASTYKILLEIAELTLITIAEYLGLERDTFVRLTDVHYRGEIPFRPKLAKKKQKATDKTQITENASTYPQNEQMSMENVTDTGEEEKEEVLSSSLLRICRYEGTLDDTPASSSPELDLAKFGAHTDTSFLTIGLSSSTPALDIFDPVQKKWIMAETLTTPRNTAHIFVGEFLQVLTNHYIRASIHRVNNFARSLPPRISCPLIIRGTAWEAIRYHSCSALHQEAGEADKDEDELTLIEGLTLPDLEGVSMKVIHKILDVKRQKCFEKYGEQEGNWVLAAYPPLISPPDTI
jgi:isopenicillin N synthase-like dioxygenase